MGAAGSGERITDVKTESRNRALIVEDEFLIALDLEASMTGLGFEICGLAPNGEEARLLAMNHQPDVVLVDVYLGGAREGIETARWLREVCDVSVVFVTAHTDAATIERIKEVVAGSLILSKPVYRERLADAVAKAIH
jgi:response regulator of citrate/malate metabolism